jgi:MFS family permease
VRGHLLAQIVDTSAEACLLFLEGIRSVQTPPAHDPYEALRQRDYRFFLVGNVLGSIGMEIQAVTVGWELYERTGSAAHLGYAGLVLFLPVLLLALPAGHLVDRLNRKVLLLTAHGLMGLASFNLASLSVSEGPVENVYAWLVLAGVARAFGTPARAALLPQIVPFALLANAVTWNSTGWQIANMAGPALGGLVLALSGQAVEAYLCAAGCSSACLVLLSFTRPTAVERIKGAMSLRTLLAGAEFVWSKKLLLAAITLDLFAVLLGGVTFILPIFQKDILKVGPEALGWMRAAPALGALFMALALAHHPPQRAGRALLLSVAGFGAATIGFGLSDNLAFSLGMLVLTGAFDNISVVIRHTLVQVLTPDHMRGRVAAINFVFISSSNELGGFRAGMAADWFGPVWSVVGGGIGTIVVVAFAALRWRGLLALGTLHGREEKVE